MRLVQQQKCNFFRNQGGFTLVELIMVMVITGILVGIAAQIIRWPVQEYVDSARRASMTDVGDTAFRRMGRDIRNSVPNSVRMPSFAGSTYIEFLPTKAGERYRVTADPGGNQVYCGAVLDTLDFAGSDTCFEILGPQINFVNGDQIVLGSTQANALSTYDPSTAGVLRAVTVTGLQSAVNIPAVQYPALAALPSQRFYVVPYDQQAVTYACVPAASLGTLDANEDGQASLVRYWKYDFWPTQKTPAQIVPLTHSEAILANKVSSCNIVYNATKQLVSITLVITRGNESINLYQEIYVNNAP